MTLHLNHFALHIKIRVWSCCCWCLFFFFCSFSFIILPSRHFCVLIFGYAFVLLLFLIHGSILVLSFQATDQNLTVTFQLYTRIRLYIKCQNAIFWNIVAVVPATGNTKTQHRREKKQKQKKKKMRKSRMKRNAESEWSFIVASQPYPLKVENTYRHTRTGPFKRRQNKQSRMNKCIATWIFRCLWWWCTKILMHTANRFVRKTKTHTKRLLNNCYWIWAQLANWPARR